MFGTPRAHQSYAKLKGNSAPVTAAIATTRDELEWAATCDAGSGLLSQTLEEMCKAHVEAWGYGAHIATKFWKNALQKLLDSDASYGVASPLPALKSLINRICEQIFLIICETESENSEEIEAVWKAAAASVIDEYSSAYRQDIYHDLINYLEKRIKMLLRPHSGAPGMLYQISSRVKTLRSYSDKVTQASTWLRKQTWDPHNPMKQDDAERLLRLKIRDLAGVRVLVYSPQDAPRVVQAINLARVQEIPEGSSQEREEENRRITLGRELIIQDNEVSFTKNRADGRKTLKGLDKRGNLSLIDGPWAVTATENVPLHDITQRWNHFGYRAIHMHVKISSKSRDLWGICQYLRLKGNDRLTIQDGVPKVLPGYLAEIQITTVVMHAWSQVEHDLFYKNFHKIPHTTTMAAMIDSINGLSITSESLLGQLQRNLSEVQMNMGGLFETSEEFNRVLMNVYLHDDIIFGWTIGPWWIVPVFQLLQIYNMMTLNEINHYIRNYADINKPPMRPLESPDICIAVLHAFGIAAEQRQIVKDKQRIEQKTKQQQESCMLRRQIFLFRTSLSIMAAMDSYLLFEAVQNKLIWRDEINEIRANVEKIEDILKQGVGGSVTEAELIEQRRLARFSETFLKKDSWCTLHDVAVAFARSGCFLRGVYCTWNELPKGQATDRQSDSIEDRFIDVSESIIEKRKDFAQFCRWAGPIIVHGDVRDNNDDIVLPGLHGKYKYDSIKGKDPVHAQPELQRSYLFDPRAADRRRHGQGNRGVNSLDSCCVLNHYDSTEFSRFAPFQNPQKRGLTFEFLSDPKVWGRYVENQRGKIGKG
jgi:ppGpp synthetase/RelA/SpoT-type nucleotidyltranferase